MDESVVILGWAADSLWEYPTWAFDVSPLRARTELVCIHIFDHTLTQRGDSRGCHGQLLS